MFPCNPYQQRPGSRNITTVITATAGTRITRVTSHKLGTRYQAVSTSTQRPVSAATGDMCPVPGPARRLVPGAGLAADTPADFYTGAESRVQQRSPVTKEERGRLEDILC